MVDWRCVLTPGPISPLGLSRLPAGRDEPAAGMASPDVMLGRFPDMHGVESPFRAKAIACGVAGESQGEMAYTRLDADGPPDQAAIGRVAAIPGAPVVGPLSI
ncbi:MAG TPA: hypothetical protein DEP05_09665 [Betaproteobacteria bacterium]|nr:hypothetical protein [Betaproteobacteria bacterium]